MEKENNKENQGVVLKVDKKFIDLVKDFIKRFEEKHKIQPSPREVTRIITEKINSVGGLKVT